MVFGKNETVKLHWDFDIQSVYLILADMTTRGVHSKTGRRTDNSHQKLDRQHDGQQNDYK